jgi:hypothetical protein
VATIPAVQTRWRKVGGKEIVEVRRVWFWPGHGWTVRAQPANGGSPLVDDAHWFCTEGYEHVPS